MWCGPSLELTWEMVLMIGHKIRFCWEIWKISLTYPVTSLYWEHRRSVHLQQRCHVVTWGYCYGPIMQRLRIQWGWSSEGSKNIPISQNLWTSIYMLWHLVKTMFILASLIIFYVTPGLPGGNSVDRPQHVHMLWPYKYVVRLIKTVRLRLSWKGV